MDKTKLVGGNLCHRKNDYETGGIVHGLFLAPKRKFCYTDNEFRIIEEHKTFKGFNDFKRLSDRSQFCEKINVQKLSAM